MTQHDAISPSRQTLAGWRGAAPLIVWLVLRWLPVPAGLSANAWHYFAVFAAAILVLMLTRLPGGAVGLVAVSFIMAMGYVHDEPSRSVAWALGSFADTTVWLTFGAFLFALGYRKSRLVEVENQGEVADARMLRTRGLAGRRGPGRHAAWRRPRC